MAGKIRIECKTTGAQSYKLNLSDLEKIKAEAFRGNDQDWAMQVEFQTGSGNKKFAIIDWQTLLDLRGES